MSLMSRIGRGLLGKAKPKPETQLRVAINQRNAEANPPKAKSAETRKRMSESQLRRNAPVEPVPTSALPTPPSPIVAVPLPARPPSPARWPKPPEVQLVDPSLPLVRVRELSDEEARARGILPDGELLVDLEEAAEKQRAAGIEVHGEPLPPPRPTPAPPSAAIVAAASVAEEKAAVAAELEAKRAEIEASAKWKGQCKAIDARNGLRCGLLHGHTVDHRSARGAFTTVAQGRLIARSVDAAAWATNN